MRDAMAAGRAVKRFVNGGISFASWCVRGSELSRGWAGMVQNSGRWKLFGVGGQTLQPSSLCSQNPGLRRGCFLQLWPSLARSLQPQQCQHKAGGVHTSAPSTCPCQSHRGACHRHKSGLPYTHTPRSHQQKLDETERAFHMRADDGEGRA